MSLFADLTNSVNAVRPTRTTLRNYDLPLVVATSLLVAIGVLMVYSAAIALADGPRFANYGRYYFVLRQTLYVGVGLFAAAFVLTVPIEAWQRTTMWIFIITMLLLVAVLIPGIGRRVNGAMRWLPIGPVTFQPSELMKLAALLFTAFSNASFLPCAVPDEPETIAPAWPIVFPSGAVNPATYPTTGFVTLALINAAARSSASPPISPIITMASVSGSS